LDTIKVRTKMNGGNDRFYTKNEKNYKYHLFLARRDLITIYLLNTRILQHRYTKCDSRLLGAT